MGIASLEEDIIKRSYSASKLMVVFYLSDAFVGYHKDVIAYLSVLLADQKD